MVNVVLKTDTCMRKSPNAAKVRLVLASSDLDSDTRTVLDDKIDEFGELLREHYKIPEFGDPSASTDVCIAYLFLGYIPENTL